MLGVDMWAVLAAAAAMFAIGGVWYMGLFARQWGEIFGFDKLSKAAQDKAKKEMGPMMLLQLAVTLLSAFAVAKVMALAPSYDFYKVALLIWGGFALPTVVSTIIFGGTEKKWQKRQILITLGEYLVHILAAAYIINLIQG